MIKKFLDKLLGKPSAAKSAKPAAAGGHAVKTDKAAKVGKPGAGASGNLGKRVEVPVSEHRIDPSLLDERAVRVVQTLSDAGFEAYIVGGAVRALLLGMR
ncbi:MAG: polynucleotide adenylyltransferase PcnB, partial [Burkholderiaceae bacterium]|nr:polynucleotide adenylyltransferase PcnB [Burkholderiaceae bacterium]